MDLAKWNGRHKMRACVSWVFDLVYGISSKWADAANLGLERIAHHVPEKFAAIVTDFEFWMTMARQVHHQGVKIMPMLAFGHYQKSTAVSIVDMYREWFSKMAVGMGAPLAIASIATVVCSTADVTLGRGRFRCVEVAS